MTTILIADDNAPARELLRTVLEGCGYRVLEAANGSEALLAAREAHPDLVILDLHMPEVDGFGVLGELRGDGAFAATPIIALTASAMPEDRLRVLEAGFTGFFTKPIRLASLRGEVQSLLRGAAETAPRSS